MTEYDAVIVGARCAGSALAGELARRGCDVLLVDRDGFPSTTVSTHNLWPACVARLEELGGVDRIRSKHELPGFESRVYGLGHETVGGFTPVEGIDRAVAPRRIVLDQAALDAARGAGATGRPGPRVQRPASARASSACSAPAPRRIRSAASCSRTASRSARAASTGRTAAA